MPKYKLKRPDTPPQYVQSERERKARAMAYDLTLTRDERLQLLQWLPMVDENADSWKGLEEIQYHDLITMMEGFLLISHLFNERM